MILEGSKSYWWWNSISSWRSSNLRNYSLARLITNGSRGPRHNQTHAQPLSTRCKHWSIGCATFIRSPMILSRSQPTAYFLIKLQNISWPLEDPILCRSGCLRHISTKLCTITHFTNSSSCRHIKLRGTTILGGSAACNTPMKLNGISSMPHLLRSLEMMGSRKKEILLKLN
jgi:hypothetical protein